MIGNKIAKFRKAKGWTQEQLADAAGISRGYIAAIEEGRIKPKIKTIAQIAKCLDVELQLLLKNR
jgi:transcriptional regulator with XRE-family HTH domain